MSCYEIIVESYTDRRRFKEFEIVELVHLENGTTRIVFNLADQSELFSVLTVIRDMNLNLLLTKKIML